MREVVAEVAAGVRSPVLRVTSVAGGDISQAARLDLADGRTIFAKWRSDAPAGMFAAEARGLAWLAEPGVITVPDVLAVGATWIALRWLELGTRSPSRDERLGRALAALHASGAPAYGLDHDNWIGFLPQANAPLSTWEAFWIERRLAPLVRQVEPRWLSRLDRLRARWSERAGPVEPPARLHGDLWSGNVHADGDEPAVIDPAAYGGHREVDLAMLALFGGLSDAIARAYEEAFPLAPGWRARLPLWQTYPLLVHAAMFGGGYAAQVDAILRALE